MNRWIRAACLILLFAGSTHADAPPKAVTVPFNLVKTKHMTVMVKINGKGPYRLIFDTGAPATVLNNKVALDSGVLARDAKKPPLTLFGAMGQLTIETLEIGDLKAENQTAIVMDHPLVEVMAKALGPIDGIVGFPF